MRVASCSEALAQTTWDALLIICALSLFLLSNCCRLHPNLHTSSFKMAKHRLYSLKPGILGAVGVKNTVALVALDRLLHPPIPDLDVLRVDGSVCRTDEFFLVYDNAVIIPEPEYEHRASEMIWVPSCTSLVISLSRTSDDLFLTCIQQRRVDSRGQTSRSMNTVRPR